MSKAKKTDALTAKEAGADLIAKVEAVLTEAANHRYSVSRVYAAHNAVFKLTEEPQTCSSCLQLRGDNLKRWYSENVKGEAAPEPVDDNIVDGDQPFNVEDQLSALGIHADSTNEERLEALDLLRDNFKDDATLASLIASLIEAATPKEDTNVYIDLAEEGARFIFVANADSVNKGKVTNVDGSAVKTGTYDLKDGRKLAVSVGGKAAIKDADLT